MMVSQHRVWHQGMVHSNDAVAQVALACPYICERREAK